MRINIGRIQEAILTPMTFNPQPNRKEITMIKNNQLRVRRFFFYGMPTNQWTVEVFRTWDDGKGCKGEAWRPASKTTFNTKAQAEKYLKSLTKPKISKSTQLMKQIKKTPLRYSEMQQFL